MLNLYSVKTRAVVREEWADKVVLDATFRNFIVSNSFDAAVEHGKTLVFKQSNESVKPRKYGVNVDMTTIECTRETTGIQIDPSVLSAQVAG